MKIVTYIFVFFTFTLSAQLSQVMELGSTPDLNWEFRKKGKSGWKPAQVPGSVYSDLQHNSMIADPYVGENEKTVQWVEAADWEYRSSFVITEQQLSAFSHAELLLEGIDTYAGVYLNDSLILTCDNMFRTWTKEIKPLLKNGSNTLRFIFKSAVNTAKTEAAKLPYALPEGERVFVRKAQYQFGWDFAPRLIGCGITKNVRISFWKGFRIRDVHIQQLKTDSSVSTLKAKIEVESEFSQPAQLSLVSDNQASKIHLEKKAALKKGLNTVEFNFSIKDPILWWCNGLGAASLYNFKVAVADSKHETLTAEKRIGLRTLELVQEKDGKGASFYFKLNGKAVFMKGANYIPTEAILWNTAGNSFPKLAAQMHMNMLRVWGGGLYEDDAFYSACDELGILVWQDFMFACAMYPGDAHFVANVKEEITEQVKRLRDHPCLALWCGNNESDEGWDNWGWQKQYKISAADSVKLWNDYKKLFHELIPSITKAYSFGTPYWPSSPKLGWGHAESLAQGDSHYWGVWWGREPFENYNLKTGRFMSEYGFQSLPAFSSFKRFSMEAEVNLNSPSVLQHQKNATGFQTIQAYMDRDFKTPEKFEDYIYVSQLLQAKGMGTAIEAHRRNKPYCMGTLFWQLNDCWPAVSWSAIDYYHEPKAVYYYAKRLYQTVLISVQEKNDSLKVFVVSDSLQALNGSLRLQLKNFNGKILWQKTVPLLVNGNSVSSYSFVKKELPVFDTSSAYLQLQYSVQEKGLAEKNQFFARPKHLLLPKATVSIQKLSADSYELSSDVFAKDVYLCFDKGGVLLSDNFFDLEPGIKRTVSIVKSYVEPDNSVSRVIILNNLINLHEK